MTRTRAQQRTDALKHVLELAGATSDTDIGKAIAAEPQVFKEPNDLVGITQDIASRLEYFPGNAGDGMPLPNKTLTPIKTFMLSQISKFVRDLNARALANGESLTDMLVYMNVMEEDWEQSRNDSLVINPPAATTNAPGTTTSATSTSTQRTPAEEFKRSVKRDISAYPVFSNEKQWDNVDKTVRSTATLHNTENVLDPNYAPDTAEEKDLFEQQQCFMFAAWQRTMLTDKAKAIVNKYYSMHDAQKVWAEVCDHQKKSTSAKILAKNIMMYIMTMRLGDGKWKGSTLGFILHYLKQIRLYEEMKPDTADHFSDAQKLSMLQAAVHKIPDLRQVETTATLDEAKGQPALTYEQYIGLLQSAAATYDQEFFRGENWQHPRRSVNAHFSKNDDQKCNEFFLEEFDDSYNADTDISYIEANVHDCQKSITLNGENNRNPGSGDRCFSPSMTAEKWRKLAKDDRVTWDKMSPHGKAVILEYSHPEQFKGADTSPGAVNLHEISAHDYLANLHNSTSRECFTSQIHPSRTTGEVREENVNCEQEQKNEEPTGDTPACSNPLLDLMCKQAEHIHPADLRRVTSTTFNKVQAANKLERQKEITLDGKKYIQKT